MEYKDVSEYLQSADLMELLSLLPEIKTRLLKLLAETDNSWMQIFVASFIMLLLNDKGTIYEKNQTCNGGN